MSERSAQSKIQDAPQADPETAGRQARIRVRDLGKVYKLYWGPRALFREIFLGAPSHHPIEALRSVNFDVVSGEAFGVVGDNGAGKSTLLKILTGTTFPSSGTVEVDGEVSALLELGTGFHPEFSGRENIYFSGALMGLSREMIKEKEAEIVAFSELGEMIDKPVKTYSTGMYVRLGFAVATGFDPDILIIDEALAVGDQNFQKKCTDRIVEFKRRGKTIFFCSHSLHQVKTLCQRAIWLDKGEVMALGPAYEVVESYNDFCRQGSRRPAGGGAEKPGQDRSPQVCWIERVRLLGSAERRFRTGDTLKLEIRARFRPEFPGPPCVGVALVRNDGSHIYTVSSAMDGTAPRRIEEDLHEITLVFPEIPLLSGSYHFNIVTSDEHNLQAYDILMEAEPFSVVDQGIDSGLVRLRHHWETNANYEG